MLEPQIDLCYTGGEWVLKDITGVYDAVDNTGGYETPNPAGSAVTSAIVVITDHDGVEHEYDVTSQIPDTVTGEITFTDLTIDLPDGITQVDYTVTAGGTDYTDCLKKAFYPAVTCCVDNLVLSIASMNPNNDDNIIPILEAHGLLMGLTTAALSINHAQITSILSLLNQICDYYDGQYGCC